MKETFSYEFNWWQKILKHTLGMWRINKDSVDFCWGYFAPRFGFELSVSQGFYFSSRYRINICLIWGHFHIKLPFKTKREPRSDWPTYGIKLMGNSLWIDRGETEDTQHTRRRSFIFDLPWFCWIFDHHQVIDAEGKWVLYSWDDDNAHYEQYPYIYVLNSGEVQHRTATCRIERRQWHRKWFPFVKMINQCISVEFDQEVGERTGSWKGGVVGSGYDMKPGETMEQCLRRMETERKFT